MLFQSLALLLLPIASVSAYANPYTDYDYAPVYRRDIYARDLYARAPVGEKLKSKAYNVVGGAALAVTGKYQSHVDNSRQKHEQKLKASFSPTPNPYYLPDGSVNPHNKGTETLAQSMRPTSERINRREALAEAYAEAYAEAMEEMELDEWY